MQLGKALLLAGLLGLAVWAEAAHAQSLSPMRKAGYTPTEVKGFRLTVGNPYSQRMAFALIPMEPGFSDPAQGAEVNPPELLLAPGQSRQVIFAFHISAPRKERTIGLCVIPKFIEGPVLPRVCGTYTGTVLTGKGG